MHIRKNKKLVMVKRGRGRGKCSGAGLQATRIVSQDGLRISTKVDKINDFNIDDNLDFEPEDEINECVVTNNQNDRTNFFDQSTVIFQNSNEDLDDESKAETDNNSILSAQVGEMIPFFRSYSQDNREKCYLNVTPSVVSQRTILDSSCSESNASSSKSSSASSSSRSSVGSVSERDFSHDEKKSLEESEDETADAGAAFKDKKVVMVTDSRNITITAFASRACKRKWNRAFRPDASAVSVSLEDVGYISQSENLSDSASESAGSVCSALPRTTLKVTVNSSCGRTCQEVGPGGFGRHLNVGGLDDGRLTPDGRNSPEVVRSPSAPQSPNAKHQSASSSPKSEDLLFSKPTSSSILSRLDNVAFKMPLPPAKRPPSRPRKSDISSLSSNNSFGSFDKNVSLNIVPARMAIDPVKMRTTKDDDIISIVASTLGGDQPEQPPHELPDAEDIVKDEQESVAESVQLDREYIERWLSGVRPEGQPSPEGQQSHAPPLSEQQSPARDGSFRIDFKSVPRFFAGLCFHHYFGNGCTKASCTLYHYVVTEKFIARCKKAASNELLDYYSLVLRFQRLLKEMYHCFLEGFAFHKMESKLIAVITDHLSPSLIATINPLDALRNIIRALEKTGLSFEETIEKISFNVGFLNYPILANILLEIISEKPNLADYWESMKRIGRACGQMPPQTVERILLKVTSVVPLDKRLCTDIYHFIVRDGRTDLSQVRHGLLQPFETFVNFGQKAQAHAQVESLSEHIESHLLREREIFERGAVPAPANGERCLGSQAEGKKSSVASSSPSSCKSSLGVHALGSETVGLEVNRYVPEAAVRRLVAPQQVVSTTSECSQSPIMILPDQPILGTTRYRADFQFNVSLHNLLPDCDENIEIHERDIARLDKALRERDGKQFLVLLESYKNPVTVSNFITMTIANLLGNLEKCHGILIDLLNDIVQSRPEFVEKHCGIIKGIFEVIVFNLLFEIEKRALWRAGRKLLEHFCDWDSLISSQLLQKFRQYLMSPMGRYIFIAKMLIKSYAFGYAFEILQCPSLHLLEAPEKWPLFNTPYCDMERRNSVLDDFFSTGYRYNVVVVAALYENIFKSGKLFGYDANSKFTSMMKSLINDEKLTSLKRFASDLFYSHMDNPILRSFTILMADEIRVEEALKLYEFGCQKNIYVRYTGRESRILIRTNMSNSEITLVLRHFLRRLDESSRPLRIEIRLPEAPLPGSPAILQRYIRSIVNVNLSVRRILADSFRIGAATMDANSTEVLVDAEALAGWMSRPFC